MAKRYSKKWKDNVSKGAKKSWVKAREDGSAEKRIKQLSDAEKKGNRIRIYTKKDFSELVAWPTIRKIIFKERGRKCEKCGWAKVNSFNKIIPIQINHIDGDKKNNSKDNLIILCPNCHSLTKHFMFYGRKHKI